MVGGPFEAYIKGGYFMSKTLTLINADKDCVVLVDQSVDEFERVFKYLYDENGSIDVFQKVDERFLNALQSFDADQYVDPDDREEFDRMFELGKHFSLEYNLTFFTFMNRLANHSDILSIMNEKNCTVQEAIRELNKQRIGIE
jgi:hypothetical protein